VKGLEIWREGRGKRKGEKGEKGEGEEKVCLEFYVPPPGNPRYMCIITSNACDSWQYGILHPTAISQGGKGGGQITSPYDTSFMTVTSSDMRSPV